MVTVGYLLYVLVAALVYMFWRAAGGRSFEELLDKAHDEHLRVHKAILAHPRGGSWPEFQAWLNAESDASSSTSG